jgi:hypothetical protein
VGYLPKQQIMNQLSAQLTKMNRKPATPLPAWQLENHQQNQEERTNLLVSL